MGRIVIVGGGITGLSAAYTLLHANTGHQVVLLERSERAGGKISTVDVEGFLIEEGPDSFLSRKRAGIELCRELGIDDRLLGRTKRGHGSYLYHAGRLHPLPEGFSGLVPSEPRLLEQTTLLSEEARTRLLREREIPPLHSEGEESVADFMRRRFGEEAFDVMIEPLVSGIFAGDAGKLSMQAAFPQLVELEQRRGYVSSEPAGAGGSPAASPFPPFVSFPRGLSELVDGLTGSLEGVRLLTGRGARSVRTKGGSLAVTLEGGEEEAAEAVVLAVPPLAAAELLEQGASELAAHLASVTYASTAVATLGFHTRELAVELDGYGYLSPMAEGRLFHACTWSSSKWPGRAPEGYSLIRLYGGRFGDDRAVGMNERELEAEARGELAHTLGIDAVPAVVHIRRWRNAIPQYNIGFGATLRAIEEARVGTPGLFLAGAAYGGVGIPDCIQSGRSAALEAVEHLRAREA